MINPNPMTYREYLAYDAHCKHRRTEKAQMEEIQEHIAALAQQHDYNSLDLIRLMSKRLTDSEQENSMGLLNLTWELLDEKLSERDMDVIASFVRGLKHKA